MSTGTTLGASTGDAYRNRLNLIGAGIGYLFSGGDAANVSATSSAAMLDYDNNWESGLGFGLTFLVADVRENCLASGNSAQVCRNLAGEIGREFITRHSDNMAGVADAAVDLLPIVGDARAVIDCINSPSVISCGGAAVGILPLAGDGVAFVIRRGDQAMTMIRQGDTITTRPATANEIAGAGNDAGDVVYRGDTRGPDEIFDEGFQPRNPGSDTSLEDYVDYNAPSDYVGTTTNRPTGDSSIEGSPEDFGTAHGDQDGFVYEIDRPSNGIDVNSQYPDGPFPNENEIAVLGGVDPSCIRGCTPIGPDGSATGDFIPNPNYNGDN
jgi:hypothetical protein